MCFAEGYWKCQLFESLIPSTFEPTSERINRIKEVLVIKGMSQKELAVQMDKNPNTITSICNNKSQPHLKDLKRIAEILDVDIRELLVPTKWNSKTSTVIFQPTVSTPKCKSHGISRNNRRTDRIRHCNIDNILHHSVDIKMVRFHYCNEIRIWNS